MTEQRFSWRAKLRSTFMVAFVAFILINVVCTFTTPFKFDPYKFSYRGWSWWTMDALRQEKQMCNVALLGSSLIVSAVAGCDANYLKRPLDVTKHHGFCYLDDQLHEKFDGMFHCFNLSAPGQMPSDAYLTLKAMLATANRPDVVIYGVAPRDFVDSTLNGPNDTEPFHYLTRIVNIDEVAHAAFRSFWSKIDWYLQKTCYFYDHALDFKLALGTVETKVVDASVPKPFSKQPFTWWDRVRIMPQYIPGEIHPEAVISAPLSEKDITFVDNTVEYRRRYKKPDGQTFRTQMHFLRKLAEYCHRERIELVLVNMPIMQENANILPAGVYQKYLHSLQEFAWNQNIVFYDLAEFSKYKKTDFHDTVHLNAFGARKFFDSLIAELGRDPRAAAALEMSGLQLQTHAKLAEQRTGRPI